MRTGTQALQPGLDRALQQGLLQQQGQRLQPTARGFDFLSDVQQLFLAGAR